MEAPGLPPVFVLSRSACEQLRPSHSGRAWAATVVSVLVVTSTASWGSAGPRLAQLAQRARWIVAGSVVGSTAYDDGRLVVTELHVDKTLKGAITAPRVAVVEMTDTSSRPVLAAETHGVAFLRRAPQSSYRNEHLPPGEYYELLPGHGAYIASDSHAAGKQIAALVARVIAPSRGTQHDPAERAKESRQLTFDLLGAPHPVLVQDGSASLALTRPPLTADELRVLSTALERVNLPERVRIELIRAVAKAGMEQAIPALRRIGAPPEVMAAAWRALDRLGDPPETEAVVQRLVSPEAGVRGAAALEMLRRQGAGAVSQVAPIVLADPDTAVRQSLVEALGALAAPQALPVLEQVFAEKDGTLIQVAGRSILAVGGDDAAASLARLAFVAPPPAQRYATVLLMTMDTKEKKAPLERLRTTHPDQEVRRLIEHGLPISEH